MSEQGAAPEGLDHPHPHRQNGHPPRPWREPVPEDPERGGPADSPLDVTRMGEPFKPARLTCKGSLKFGEANGPEAAIATRHRPGAVAPWGSTPGTLIHSATPPPS